MAFEKRKLTKEDLEKYKNSDIPSGKYLEEGMSYVYDEKRHIDFNKPF